MPMANDPKPTEEQKKVWRERLFKQEAEVLKVCCFQLDFRTPFDVVTLKHPYIAGAITGLTVEGNDKRRRVFVKMARTVVPDAFVTIAW